MVKSWVFRGVKNGVLTTKYPAMEPTVDEIPVRSIPTSATTESSWVEGKSICPTDAIQLQPKRKVDLGKCIYCRRCDNSGFVFKDVEERRRNTVLQAKTLTVKDSDKEIIKEFEKKRRT